MLYSTRSWLYAARMYKHRWWRPLLWAGLLTLALMLAWQAMTTGALLAADAIAINEPWRFVDESKPGAPVATGELATAVADAPTQVAARFNISSTMQALALQLNDVELRGLPLAQVEELRYCTRLVDGPRPYAVTLQLNIDADVRDGDDNWQGRLVYTPAYNGAVIQGEWQCWNTLVGKWWATGGPVAEYAPVESPQPLGTLLARFPNLGINHTYSVVALKAGDGWNYFQGEASPVVIGVEGERIDIAFGVAPQDEAPDNQVLLPVVFNEPADSSQNSSNKDDKDKDNKDSKDKDSKDKDKKKDKEDQKNNGRWRAVELDDLNWYDFDWNSVDWEKVDWEHLDWDAFGWRGAHAQTIRAFVNDVKQCKKEGWDKLGFSNPGNCVAYYVQAHTPTGQDANDLDWRRNWNRRDGDDDKDDDKDDDDDD